MVEMKITKSLLESIKACEILPDGREKNDPRVLFVDVTPRPLSVKEQIQRLLRVELSAQARAQGFETFEEADDFDVEEEDPEPKSPYEVMKEEVPIAKTMPKGGPDIAKEKTVPDPDRVSPDPERKVVKGRSVPKKVAKVETEDDGGLGEIDLDE